MAKYDVTGLRYQLDKSLTLDERTRMAEKIVRGLQNGTPVTLTAEPDNPKDENAIAAYIQYCHRGYIKHECCEEVMPLLDRNGQCEAVVCGNDGHLTFTIEIPNAPDNVQTPVKAKRCLPEGVLPRELIMPFSKEERQLQLVASQLDELPISEDNIGKLIEMTDVYLPLSRVSLSKDDNLWRDHIAKKVEKALRLNITEEQKQKLEKARTTMRNTQGDFHRTHENLQGKVFEQQLSKLRLQAEEDNGLYANFETYLTNSRKECGEVIESLKGWFAEMPRVKFRDYHNHDQLAMSLNYLKVSRRELYEVYSAILLIERYEKGEDLLPKEQASLSKESLDKAEVNMGNKKAEVLPEKLLINNVFSVDIFTTNERLEQLRNAIANAISWGNDRKIDLSSKYEWYWLYAALLDAGMFELNKNRDNKVTDISFVNQIMKWFPDIINNEEGKDNARQLCKAISTERKKWSMNSKPLGIKDVEANRTRLVGVKTDKINHFIEVAYNGLYVPLMELKKGWI